MHTLVYYSKPDCPLCDKSWSLAAALAARHRLDLQKVDILSDPALERRYGQRIPVLVLGDQELGWGRLSERALDRRLQRALVARSGCD
jgi:glutaredoxin